MHAKLTVVALTLAVTALASACSIAKEPSLDSGLSSTAPVLAGTGAQVVPAAVNTPQSIFVVGQPAPFSDRVTLETTRPHAGQSIRITGGKWIPGSELEISVTANQGASVPKDDGTIVALDPIYLVKPTAIIADAQGRVDTQITVPADAIHQNANVIIASPEGFVGDRQCAATPMTIGHPE